MNPPTPQLRVALVASSLRRGGAEKQVVYVARALFEAGVNLRFYYLGDGGSYETVLREMGVSVHKIYQPNEPWRILAKLTRALRRWRPQIVLAFQFGDLRFAGPAGRLSRALVLGGVQSDGWYELRTYRLSRLMFRLAHGIMPNSQMARRTLASQGVPLGRMEVLANVLDLRDFDARSQQSLPVSLPPDRAIVAAVGSLQPCKRFDRFLEALTLARRAEPTLAGVIAGADYGVKESLQEQATALGLGADDVRFLGECHNVPALLARSAMLVLSSDYEGLPNVLLEAMAARLPVITTPVGDAAAVVRHGATGFVVNPGDPKEMAARMIKLAQLPALRSEFGEAGRKRVEQEYNYESLADRLLETFRTFASQHRRTDLLELLDHGRAVNKAATPAVFAESAAV